MNKLNKLVKTIFHLRVDKEHHLLQTMLVMSLSNFKTLITHQTFNINKNLAQCHSNEMQSIIRYFLE